MANELSLKSNNYQYRHRNQAIDILRVLGILLIILAHTSLCKHSDSIGFNIRNFDVVMMVFISGLSFCETYKPIKTFKDFCFFVWKRFKRLVIPCWIFITLYFLFCFLMKPVFPNEVLSLSNVLLSYSLISGFGYVWIVRVFFLLSIAAPFMKFLAEKSNNIINLLISFIVLFMVSFVAFFTKSKDDLLGKIINTIVLQFFAYGAVYFFAISYSAFSYRLKIVVFLVLLTFTILWCLKFGFNLQENKYPPSSSFLTYGIVCSIFLYELLSFIGNKGCITNPVIIWMSKNSFTIYFCHIFILFFFSYSNFLENQWLLQYLIIVSSSIVLAIFIALLKKIFKHFFCIVSKRNKKDQ